MKQLKESVLLAWEDWRHEWLLSLCAVLALASMLTPILILIGLKNGMIEGMRQKLTQDPAILIITPKSDAGKFSPDFIKQIGALDGASFAIGRTRETSTDISLVNPESGTRSSIAFEPAAKGEPVLANLGLAAPENGEIPQIVLSAPAAKALNINKEGMLNANVGRRTPAGKFESITVPLNVSAVLPLEAADRKMAFAPLEFMEEMENYRDYIAVPSRKLEGRKPGTERQYASFRLYAKNLDAVEKLSTWLENHKIEVLTRSREIASVRMLENAINNVIFIISLAVGTGFIAFSLSSAESAVKRKYRMLGLLRLLGFNRLPLLIFPLAQAGFTALSGFAISLFIYFCASIAIGSIFNTQGLAGCYLSLKDLISALICVLALSLLASIRSAQSAANVEPSTAIREI